MKSHTHTNTKGKKFVVKGYVFVILKRICNLSAFGFLIKYKNSTFAYKLIVKNNINWHWYLWMNLFLAPFLHWTPSSPSWAVTTGRPNIEKNREREYSAAKMKIQGVHAAVSLFSRICVWNSFQRFFLHFTDIKWILTLTILFKYWKRLLLLWNI